MRLLLPSHIERMIAQGRATRAAQEAGRPEPNHKPLVKLFTPDAGCTWLLSELDPDEPDIAFGLCDLGQGTPELGSVRISELASLRGPLGLPVERDRHFRPDRSLIAYARDAATAGSISA